MAGFELNFFGLESDCFYQLHHHHHFLVFYTKLKISYIPVASVLPWSSLEEGDEGSHLHNCQTNLVIVFHELFLLYYHFINTTAYN